MGGHPGAGDVGYKVTKASVVGLCLIPEDIRRVKRGYRRLGQAAWEILAPLDRDFEVFTNEVLGAGSSNAQNDFRLNEADLLFEPGSTLENFILLGSPVDRLSRGPIARSALDGVADVDVGSGKSIGGEGFVKQLTRAADKGAPGFILFVAGAFTHKDQRGLWISFAKDGVSAAQRKVALLAKCDLLSERFKFGAWHLPRVTSAPR